MADTPSYPWRGLLCLNGLSDDHEAPVLVVGETPKQYRIVAIERMRLAGRMRWLNPGRRALVPRYSHQAGYLKCSVTRTSNERSRG
jgi:hypothetical protein